MLKDILYYLNEKLKNLKEKICANNRIILETAEFTRRHNTVLRHLFERVKNGNKKCHKLAVIAVANCIARYIYSIMKNKSSFVIMHENIMRLPEETRNMFFKSISLDFPKNTRKQIYQYFDINGEIHRFVYKNEANESAA